MGDPPFPNLPPSISLTAGGRDVARVMRDRDDRRNAIEVFLMSSCASWDLGWGCSLVVVSLHTFFLFSISIGDANLQEFRN